MKYVRPGPKYRKVPSVDAVTPSSPAHVKAKKTAQAKALEAADQAELKKTAEALEKAMKQKDAKGKLAAGQVELDLEKGTSEDSEANEGKWET